jgi:hypothetical protein
MKQKLTTLCLLATVIAFGTKAQTFRFVSGSSATLSVCQNASTATNFSSIMKVVDSTSGRTIRWSIASSARNGITAARYSATSRGGSVVSPPGSAVLTYLPNLGFSGRDSFTVRASNGLDSTTILVAVTVNAVTPPTISGDTALCVGSSVTLTGSPSGGSFFRTTSYINVTSAGVVTTTGAGVGTVTYSVRHSSGCFVRALQNVRVRSRLSSRDVIVPPVVCGNFGFWTFEVVTPKWGGTWSSSNSDLLNVLDDMNGYMEGGSYYSGVSPRDSSVTMTYATTSVCGSESITINVRTLGAVVPSIIGTTTPLCVGDTRTFTTSSALTDVSWSSGSTAIASYSGSLFTGVSAGEVLIAAEGIGSCGYPVRALSTLTVGAPTPSITGSRSLAIGGSTSLSASVPGGTWSTTGAGVATVSRRGVVTGRRAGSDSVFYRVSNTCGTGTARTAITVLAEKGASSASLSDEATLKMEVYPNPTPGVLNIDFEQSTEPKVIYVTDLAGKVVFATTTTEANMSIDLGSYPTGMYLIKVTAGAATHEVKVMKQ